MHYTKYIIIVLFLLPGNPNSIHSIMSSHSLISKLVSFSHHNPHVFQKALVFSQLMKKCDMSSDRLQKEQVFWFILATDCMQLYYVWFCIVEFVVLFLLQYWMVICRYFPEIIVSCLLLGIGERCCASKSVILGYVGSDLWCANKSLCRRCLVFSLWWY